MFTDRGTGETTSQERRDLDQPDRRVLGHVVQCDGSRAVISALIDPDNNDGDSPTSYWTVGKMISINLEQTRTVGIVYDVSKADRLWEGSSHKAIEISVELVGEVKDHPETRKPMFDRGITVYPHIGAISHRIRARDLAAIYDLGGRSGVTIGTLAQDEAIDANIAIDDTLSRHFAVVGTTGVGKSTAVSLLMRKAVEARPDLRILVMDPHNEFAAALPELAVRIDTNTLDLPFWLFRLEEFAEVLFRGREIETDEVDLLRDFIPQAKHLFRSPGGGAYIRRTADALTADTPVPYRIADLLKFIDDRMGQLDAKEDRPALKALRTRIEAAVNDPRYRFMFNSRMIDDNIHRAIGHIFRVPHEGKPITCFEMAGLPSEVVNAVCSVLARMAFDLALYSDGKLKLLLMCEEAHRYLPSDSRLGFAPTRHALSRIAKEGRKYGCYLGVVTQRPGELDPTILSQCSTVFTMRLANEIDQAIIKSAISDSSASTLSFLSSMGQREAIVFGEGVATTMRMKFERLDLSRIPGRGKAQERHGRGADDRDVDLVEIVDRLRNVPKPQPQGGLSGAAVAPLKQAGESDFRRPTPTLGETTSGPALSGGRFGNRLRQD
ncbi:ATP-binding protein [Arvimicrobium flavum]|uniref:ATP-binding protein n=1 Tax=Arvimicrobium flavum TaxID=3393320 RepID=UPI00237B1A22|nr:ATP-binding protein [Mesorhizobium shangrilense]